MKIHSKGLPAAQTMKKKINELEDTATETIKNKAQKEKGNKVTEPQLPLEKFQVV